MIASAVGATASAAVGVVLVVAGVAKVASPTKWREEASGLGVGPRVSSVVPFAEVLLGAAAVTQLHRALTGWIAAAVFAAFGVLLCTHLVRGRRPVCACFGALSRRPIGWGSVARNAALLAVAVVAAVV